MTTAIVRSRANKRGYLLAVRDVPMPLHYHNSDKGRTKDQCMAKVGVCKSYQLRWSTFVNDIMRLINANYSRAIITRHTHT